jgi:hypothetical protein
METKGDYDGFIVNFRRTREIERTEAGLRSWLVAVNICCGFHEDQREHSEAVLEQHAEAKDHIKSPMLRNGLLRHCGYD